MIRQKNIVFFLFFSWEQIHSPIFFPHLVSENNETLDFWSYKFSIPIYLEYENLKELGMRATAMVYVLCWKYTLHRRRATLLTIFKMLYFPLDSLLKWFIALFPNYSSILSHLGNVSVVFFRAKAYFKVLALCTIHHRKSPEVWPYLSL